MPDIGPRIGVDGEKEFRRDIANVAQSLKTLNSEMKVVKSSFEGQARSTEQLKKENDVLERSVLTLRDKLKLQEDALAKSARKYGEADDKTMKWQQAVNETTAALNKAEAQIRENNAAMDGFGNAADDASKKTVSLKSILSDLRSTAAIGGIIAVAKAVEKIGTAAFDAAKNAAEFADNINTLSKVTGLSTEQLQAFQYMSSLIDVDLNTLTTNMARLTRNMYLARKGTGDAATAFEMLGINVTDDNDVLRSNKDVFIEVIDILSGMTDETERDAAAMAIFGESAQNLNPLIVAGAEALEDYMDEAERLGLVYSQEELDKLNSFNDGIDRMKAVLGGLRNDVVLQYVDQFNGAVESGITFVQELREELSESGLGGVYVDLQKKVLDAYGSFANFVTGLPIFRDEFDFTTTAVGRLVTAFQNLISKINIFKSTAPDGMSVGGIGASYNNTSTKGPSRVNNGVSPYGGSGVTINTTSLSQSEVDYIYTKFNKGYGGQI